MPFIWKENGIYTDKAKKAILFFINYEASLIIVDPKMTEDIYTTNNKYFTKHPLVGSLLAPFFGKSILASDSNDEWRARRKALAPTFYKGKLVKMVEIAKESVRSTINSWNKECENKPEGTIIQLISETSKLQSRIILRCAIYEDLTDTYLDYWSNGKTIKKSVPEFMHTMFHDMINRFTAPHVIFFPELASTFITPHERDILANAKSLRNSIAEIIERRKKEILKDSSLLERGDLLTIMLTDDLFKDNNEGMIDEILTFF